MLTFHAGEDVVVTVPLERDGEPFLAESASWSLRDQAGVSVTAYTDVSLTELSDTSVQVTIPAAANVIDPAKRFEKRFIVVKGLDGNGEPFMAMTNYRLTAWLNYTVTNRDVRAYAGIDAGEFPDAAIDLVSAYFEIAYLVGEDKLTDALTSGGQKEQVANRGIVAQAVLRALPGLRQAASKKASDGSLLVERFEINWDQLELDIARDLNAVTTLVGEEAVDLTAVPTLFILAGPTTDPITNEDYT